MHSDKLYLEKTIYASVNIIKKPGGQSKIALFAVNYKYIEHFWTIFLYYINNIKLILDIT